MLKLTQMDKVRARIAPSPTGFAHVGTAYTALFNYAFARHNGGKFIIRIEDSDLKRNIEGSEEKIYQVLSWLGISWDEGPYKLSERLELYKRKAKELLDRGLAYEDEGAIRFKNPKEDVSWVDLVRGEIKFSGEEITDFVIMKSDGYPTYNFNVVVDDIAMQITHVIRGEDHISNTPRQIALYRAFGVKHPEFAHHPMLLNAKRQKLSKRDAAVDVEEYRRLGILPEALVNFLSLMGWSHPDEKEIFDMEEFVREFTLERVRKSGAIFDINKLLWVNQKYINNFQLPVFISRIISFYDNKYPRQKVEQIAPLVQSRIRTLKEFESIAGFFFEAPKVDKNMLSKNYRLHLAQAIDAIDGGKPLEDVPKENNFKTGDFFMDLRIALTGKRVTPPINESIAILGNKEAVKRIRKALE